MLCQQDNSVKLSQGKFALVDEQDYDFLMKWKWCTVKWRKKFYAVRSINKGQNRTLIIMHRIVIERAGLNINNKRVDHIDRNGLNNQRENLRLATNSQNLANCRKYKNNTSGYKGVSWYKHAQKWCVRIQVNGQFIYLGLFTNKIEAARCYDAAALKYFGRFATLNFTPSKFLKK